VREGFQFAGSTVRNAKHVAFAYDQHVAVSETLVWLRNSKSVFGPSRQSAVDRPRRSGMAEPRTFLPRSGRSCLRVGGIHR
jgi:hypothetical protein